MNQEIVGNWTLRRCYGHILPYIKIFKEGVSMKLTP